MACRCAFRYTTLWTWSCRPAVLVATHVGISVVINVFIGKIGGPYPQNWAAVTDDRSLGRGQVRTCAIVCMRTHVHTHARTNARTHERRYIAGAATHAIEVIKSGIARTHARMHARTHTRTRARPCAHTHEGTDRIGSDRIDRIGSYRIHRITCTHVRR